MRSAASTSRFSGCSPPRRSRGLASYGQSFLSSFTDARGAWSSKFPSYPVEKARLRAAGAGPRRCPLAKSFSVLSQIHVKRFAMRTWTFRAAHRRPVSRDCVHHHHSVLRNRRNFLPKQKSRHVRDLAELLGVCERDSVGSDGVWASNALTVSAGEIPFPALPEPRRSGTTSLGLNGARTGI